jgi:hypothetical protein
MSKKLLPISGKDNHLSTIQPHRRIPEKVCLSQIISQLRAFIRLPGQAFNRPKKIDQNSKKNKIKAVY